MSDFNLDTVDDGGYTPVTVTYRGKEYAVGTSAYALISAPGLLNVEGKSGEEVGAALVAAMPKLLKLLGPELHAAIEADEKALTIGEELMLIHALTEVLNRIGRFRVSAEAPTES